MHTKEQYIAVFDSGVGGISVLRELVRLMPNERFLYFGDSRNAPYGTRSKEAVRELTLAAAQRLMDRGVKALVVACNTATAVAIQTLRSRYPDTIIIGIEPALKVAADRYGNGRIGVMATPVTLAEEKFQQQVERFPHLQVTPIPAPGLVELIEAGKADSDETRRLLRQLLAPHVGRLDALVLGCTHYPFVSGTIRELLGPDTALLDGGEGTARETLRRLRQAGLCYDGPGEVIMENSLDDPAILARANALLTI